MTQLQNVLMVVDDDPEMHEGLRFILNEYEVRSCLSNEEALAAARAERIPVVILDLQLKESSGLETLRQLKQYDPAQQIIVLTGQANRDNAISALNLGAFRYVTKPFDVVALKSAIKEALERYKYECSFVQWSGDISGISERVSLTTRETEIYALVIRGLSNEEMAGHLQVSRRTIEKHMENIFLKFQVKSRAKLIQKAAKMSSGFKLRSLI